MKCPTCQEVDLVMSDRQGVEIDYCPRCRGVWLDRGELDKIIERTATITPPNARESTARERDDDDWREPKRREDDSYPPKKKKRESFLGDLFDF